MRVALPWIRSISAWVTVWIPVKVQVSATSSLPFAFRSPLTYVGAASVLVSVTVMPLSVTLPTCVTLELLISASTSLWM